MYDDSPHFERGLAVVLTPEQEAECLLLVKMAVAAVQDRQPPLDTDDAIAVVRSFMDNAEMLDEIADDYAEVGRD